MKHAQQYIRHSEGPQIKGMRFVWLLLLFVGGLFSLYMAIVDGIAYTHLSANSIRVTKPQAQLVNCTMVPLIGDILPSPVVTIRFLNAQNTASTLKIRTSYGNCAAAQRGLPLVIRSSRVNPQLSMLEPDYQALPLRFTVVGMVGFGCLLFLAGWVIIRILMSRPKTYRVEQRMDQPADPDEPQKTPAA